MHLVQKVVQLLRVAVAVFLDELGQRIHAGGRIAQVVDQGVIAVEGTPDEVFDSENARMQGFLGKFREK